jgi:ribonuclease E
MLINAIDPEESRIAVVEDGVLQELHVELANREAYLGNIYKGKVVNIEPSIGAAFVAFGGRVNGFLHVSDVLPAYGRPEFMLDDVIEGRARVDVDDGPESMQQALADDDDDEGGDAGPAKAGPRGGPEDHDGDEPEIEPSNVTVAEHDDEAAVEPVDPAEHEHGHHKDAVDADAGADGPRGADEPPPGGGGEDDGFGDGIERPLNMAAAGDGPEGDGADGDGGPEAGPAATPTPTSAAPDGGDAVVNGSADGATDGDADAAGAAGPGGGGDKRGRRNRRGGNRDRSGERRPRGPRPTIDQLLKKGQEVVVQITKEGIGSKGPTLTTYVSLPGRCLVLMPSLPKCGVSRKIEDARERKRLKRIVRELDETGSGGIGFIVRTAGVNKSLQDLQRDRDYLKKIWEMVAQRLKVTRAPALLYQESDLVLKAMRDQFTPDIADVVVDSEDVFLRIRDFAEKLMPHMAERIKQHAMTTPLFHHFGIEKEVEALYQPKIDLPNGASIVIDQAEALVAIDVNSGKYKAGGDSDETAYRTNLDAIPEIVRQLRLRDLGGLIIIDFIDMAHEKHRRGVEKRLIDALHGDRARIKVGRISPFGMLEITRQRVGPGLKRTVFMQCPHCKGAGWSRTVQSKALSVLRESRALVNLKGYSVLQVFAAPAVTDYLVNHKRRAVLELEDAVGKTILFRPEASYPIDVVHYRFLTGDGQEARIAIPAGLGVKA